MPLTSLMALPAAGVKSAKDLAGKRVGTSGIPYQSAYLKTILETAGVDPGSVKETNVGFNLVPAMVSKKVDATLGAFWNYEGVQLAPRKPVILRMENLGVPTYNELILVARRESLDAAGASRLRRFITATAAGDRLVRDNPTAGVDALVKADKGLDRGLQEAAIKATLPAFFPKDRSAVGLDGAGRLGQLRALDAQEPAAQAAALRGAAADQRVPARGGPGIVRARMR